MAMTAAQITAELQRKKNAGIMPTNQANMAEYNSLTKQPATTSTNNSPLNTTGVRGVNVEQAYNNNTNPTPQYGYNFNQLQQNSLLNTATNNMLAPRQEFKVDLASLQQDPVYLAAMDNAKQTAQVASGNISSDLNRRGIMDSDINSRASSNAAQNAYSRVSSEILPGLIEQSYKRFIDRQNADRQNSLDLVGLSDTYGNNNQTAFNNSLSVSDRTGVLTLPQAQDDIDRLLSLKSATEKNWMTMTPEQRTAARTEGDDIRARLTRMGIDVSNIGADVKSNKASANAGIQTLAGRSQDLFEQNQNFTQGITMAELTGTLPDGTKTTAEQQRLLQNEWVVADQTGTITPTLAKMYGIPAGMPTRPAKEFAQQIAISQQNANTSAFSASNAAGNAAFGRLMDVWSKTGSAPAGLEAYGIAPGTPISAASGSGNKPTPYHQNPNWASEIADINSNPSGQYDFLTKNSQMYIGEYGYDGYQELLNQARKALDY